MEASPEQLASAMATAEELSEGGGPKARVIGWYHSHPHITVLPSHVDVRTQASYQMLDEGFVGIIISAFNRVRRPPCCVIMDCAVCPSRVSLAVRQVFMGGLKGRTRAAACGGHTHGAETQQQSQTPAGSYLGVGIAG